MKDIAKLDLTALRRKRDQAWELAALARKDSDHADELRWINKARRYVEEISRRINEEKKQ